MKKWMLIVISCLLVVIAAGCSEGAGNGANNTSVAEGLQGAIAIPAPDPNKQSTIVFSMFKKDPYFEAAIAAYRKAHPNTKINLKYQVNNTSEDISGAKQEKFESTMIADFLNGKGPDLVVMDHLPTDKYMAKGLLADVGAMLRGDASIKQEDYYGSIWDSLRESDGGLYALPLSFSLNTWIGDQALLEQSGVVFDEQTWTWDQFIDVAKQLAAKSHDNRSGFLAYDENMVLWEMVKTNYSQFVDTVHRKAYFESDEFFRLLEQIKGLEDSKTVKYYKEQKEKGKLGDNPVFFNETQLYTPYQYFLNAKLAKEEFNNHSPAFYEKPKAEGQPARGYFEPHLKIAINEKSGVKPEAWDFLKFLLSGQAGTADAWGERDLTYEGQGYNGMFPISRKVYEGKTNKMVQEGVVQATERDLQRLESLIVHANKPVISGEVLRILIEEAPVTSADRNRRKRSRGLFRIKLQSILMNRHVRRWLRKDGVAAVPFLIPSLAGFSSCSLRFHLP